MKNYRGHALIIDDDQTVLRMYEKILSDADFHVATGTSLKDLEDQLQRRSFELILLDLNLGSADGMDGLPFILKNAPFAACFVLTADESLQRAVECMRRGATGYLTKNMPPDQILAHILKQLPDVPSTDAARTLEAGGLIGESRAITETIETIHKIKDVDTTVLILGESGTGKEVVARTIHQLSPRARHRFEAINCAAIPENLLESELFGHKRGAFTDAKSDHKGIFEVCSKGTLLLDEIGDMPLALQTKLLRVLQERQVHPVGAERPVDIDTRVIAATHRTIRDEIEAGRFREDLYFRLSVVAIQIPPLRHRTEDIPLLVAHFLEKFNQRFDKDVTPPDAATMRRLQAYDWPGNVRELQNAVERGVVLSTDGRLHLEDMFQHLTKRHGGANGPVPTDVAAEAFKLPLTEAKQAFEKAYLENLLRVTHGNISEVARIAGRYRADVYRIMARYTLDFDEYRDAAGHA